MFYRKIICPDSFPRAPAVAHGPLESRSSQPPEQRRSPLHSQRFNMVMIFLRSFYSPNKLAFDILRPLLHRSNIRAYVSIFQKSNRYEFAHAIEAEKHQTAK